MSVKLQILQTSGSATPTTTFTANGTAACLGGESISVTVVLVPPGFGSSPVVQGASLTAISGAAGFSEWSATFTGTIPNFPFVLYALAYNSSDLVAEISHTVSSFSGVEMKKRDKRNVKKKSKKIGKKK